MTAPAGIELPCVYCLMCLASPASLLRIQPPDFGSDGAAAMRFSQTVQGGYDLAPKIAAMREAFTDGRSVEINGTRVTEPLTTWQGDPICQPHLWEVNERYRQPRTVRMAQWGPRR